MEGSPNKESAGRTPAAVQLTIQLCVPEDQRRYLPRRVVMPEAIDPQGIPRLGEVVYLGNTAWGVSLIAHCWPSPTQHRIEVWIERVIGRSHERPSGFAITQ